MAIKKKKSGGGGANWMDTYGDMVTLLLCFFVLLYSMSTIDSAKWEALVMSFNPLAAKNMTETPKGGEGPSADADEGGVLPKPEETDPITQEQVDMEMEELVQALQSYVESSVNQSNITVEKKGGKVYITFDQAVFFNGESSVLRPEAEPVLDDVARMLEDAGAAIDDIRVQGHTARIHENGNNVRNDRTLASMRATNVVIYLQEHSELLPAQLIAEGIGEWQPKGDNNTSEGRAKNRRVEMIVSGLNVEEMLEDSGQEFFTTTTGASG